MLASAYFPSRQSQLLVAMQLCSVGSKEESGFLICETVSRELSTLRASLRSVLACQHASGLAGRHAGSPPASPACQHFGMTARRRVRGWATLFRAVLGLKTTLRSLPPRSVAVGPGLCYFLSPWLHASVRTDYAGSNAIASFILRICSCALAAPCRVALGGALHDRCPGARGTEELAGC